MGQKEADKGAVWAIESCVDERGAFGESTVLFCSVFTQSLLHISSEFVSAAPFLLSLKGHLTVIKGKCQLIYCPEISGPLTIKTIKHHK